MNFILIIAIIFLLIFPYIRIIIFHPLKISKYIIIDFYKFLRYKKYNKPKSGSMICYSGHFGKGKTLSMVFDVVRHFKKYNNKKWYNGKEWLTNNVIILSNVQLNVPFIYLSSASQITNYMESLKNVDDNVYREIYICVDEASVVFNSRNFKENINPLLLNSLLTCRHYNASFYYTSQKFKLVDALLRSVTQEVRACGKFWRLAWYRSYNADEVELKPDLKELKPINRLVYLATDTVYNYYDSLATVDNLAKNYTVNDMLSSQEILSSISGQDITNVSIDTKRKRLFGRR